MSHLNALITDLRDRKLWPIPLVLVIALVAVPVLLSKSPASAPAANSSVGLGVGSTQSGPVVTDAAAPVEVPLSGNTRDPFVQQKLGGAKVVMSAQNSSGASTVSISGGATVSSGSATTASAGSTGTGSSGNGYYNGSTGSGSTTTGTPTTTTTTPSHPSTPAGLSATQAYHVAISITNPAGGVTPLDPFSRDGALPSDHQPLLVELGVAQGAQRVLFSVQPGAMLSGPGACTPGPLDCEVLSLAPGQTESVSGASRSGSSAMFQITGISVDQYGSAAAANRARSTTDAVGRALLAESTSNTLPLFQYDPSLDVVVDERNLTVGGN